MLRRLVLGLLVLAFAVSACTVATPTAPQEKRTLTIMSHDSLNMSDDVLAAFEAQCGCMVRFLRSGDTGLALNQAILAKDNPLADVFFGVDNTFFSRALKEDLFEPYASPQLAYIPDELELDPEHRLLPVDVGYVALNYDKAYFAEHNLPLPATLRDLTKPEYKSLLVVENPATSSPGLAFLLATVAAFGEEGDYTYLDFWRELRENDVYVSDGWEDAYFGQFSGASDGTRPIVVSYATSPPAGVYFADPQPTEAPTANLLLPKSSFRQIEFVGILKGAKNPDLARQWIDFMLGETFQADIPLQMFVYPAREGTPLPEIFVKYSEIPADPAILSPEEIDAGRERWLEAWTDVMLR